MNNSKDKRRRYAMGLDLLLFQADKDGNPEAIKESQRARFKSDAIVDEIQNAYKNWVKGFPPLLCLRAKGSELRVGYLE